MKKICLFLCLLTAAVSGWSASVPDNMYFHAMKDEMTRSLKKLRMKDNPKPYYIAYKLKNSYSQVWSANLGGEYAAASSAPNLEISAVLAVGSAKEDNLGFEGDRFYYQPSQMGYIPQSYWGIRHALWQMSNQEFLAAVDSYKKKQTYKEQKQIKQDYPDFASAKQATFVEEIPAFAKLPDEPLQAMVTRLSAKGKGVDYLNRFGVNIVNEQADEYYLNSDGGLYQLCRKNMYVSFSAEFYNQAGYLSQFSKVYPLPAGVVPNEQELSQQADEVLRELDQMYRAKKVEQPYLGPVLLTPRAAVSFLEDLFVADMNHVTPLLQITGAEDPTAGAFRNKEGMRVMSNVVEAYDKPLEREYRGITLQGFMPVDDEGVRPQELKLVSSGRLLNLPLSRRAGKKNLPSNGHARMGDKTYPREALSNVFITAKNPLSQEELESKLLARCRELELEYGYILHEFQPGQKVLQAERIYTADGRREPVFFFEPVGLNARALRDILAAGADDKMYALMDVYGRKYSLVAPSLLVDETELTVREQTPDRKPLIAKP